MPTDEAVIATVHRMTDPILVFADPVTARDQQKMIAVLNSRYMSKLESAFEQERLAPEHNR